MIHPLKCFTCLSFLLWCVLLLPLRAENCSFWQNIQLHNAFCIQTDRYKTRIKGMHPGIQNGEMEINGETIDGTAIQSYLIRWHHAPSIFFEKDKNKDDFAQNGYDPKSIFGFTGRGMTLATQLLASIDLSRLRIGAGVGIRCSFFNKLVGQWVDSRKLDDGQHNNSNALIYIPARSWYFTWSPLVRLGFKLIKRENDALFIDGTWAPRIYNFSELGRSWYWIYRRNVDLGATWEQQLAHYVNWSLRLAYSVCLHSERVQALDEPSSQNNLLYISHYIGGIIAQVGMSIRIPGLSKCAIVGCCTKSDHKHNGKYYRGDTLFTGL